MINSVWLSLPNGKLYFRSQENSRFNSKISFFYEEFSFLEELYSNQFKFLSDIINLPHFFEHHKYPRCKKNLKYSDLFTVYQSDVYQFVITDKNYSYSISVAFNVIIIIIIN